MSTISQSLLTKLQQDKPLQGADVFAVETGDAQSIKEGAADLANGEKVEAGTEADENNREGEAEQNQAVSSAGPGIENVNGVFPNMDFGAAGNMDQMQMMMAMQNGMPAGAFGSFPMMGSFSLALHTVPRNLRTDLLMLCNAGMPGMGMDPMAMQSMYMNGGFGAQGMGMNGMNMNMGMGGFGGGPNNNWNNGQQSWNVGQDNFNHPNAAGMGNGGDYGSFNSGYQNTGYNQGNYGQANQFNAYGRNQYGGGFRGRGRGGRGSGYGFNGRGGYYQNQNGYGAQGNYQEQQNFVGQSYQQGQMDDQTYNNGAGMVEGGDHTTEVKNEGPAVDEFGREIRADEAANGGEGHGTEQADPSKPGQPDGSDVKTAHDDPSYVAPLVNGAHVPEEHSVGPSGAFPGPNGHDGPVNTGYGSRGASLQPVGSRSGSVQLVPAAAPDVPLNAPKGPKALLRGLPNTSYLTLQARGLVQDDLTSRNQYQNQQDGIQNTAMTNGRSRSSSPGGGGHSKKRDDESHRRHRRDRSRERGSDRERDYDDKNCDDRDRARSRSPSRSRSRHGKESRRHRKAEGSQSATVRDEHDKDESRSKRHRRKESSHKHADEVVSETVGSKDVEEDVERRSRSVSPGGTKRSSHHRSSRKDRDGEKRSSRDKDYDRDRDYDRQHRSHRDRDYDRRDRDKDKDKDRHRDRDGVKDKDRSDRKERRRDRDRDREHRHRSSKRTSAEPPMPVEAFNPPSGPRADSSRGLEIKGRSGHEAERRRSSVTTGPTAADPHAAEREARNRERLLKETRRMATLASLGGPAGAKRGRGDDTGESGERRSSRRKGRRGEVVSVDDEEERMRRLEEERESARFRDD